MTLEYFGQLAYVLFIAALLLICLAGLLLVYRKFVGVEKATAGADDSIEIVSSRYLSSKAKIHVVKYGDESFMVVDNGASCAITGLKS